MSTFLFDKIVFGPVQSRRLGVSLGINLLPTNKKICSFNCVYCECGLNGYTSGKPILPTREEVRIELEQKLKEMSDKEQKLDIITYAGNGEPTMHPDFSGIIDDTIDLRDRLSANTRIAVLSNAYHLNKEEVRQALLKIDDNILKLDSGLEKTIQQIDQPNGNFNLNEVVDNLKWFKGNIIIQTMLVKGEINGVDINNTNEVDIVPWLEILKQLKPQKVMLYTIDRDTPYDGLKKVDIEIINNIARKVEQLGISVQVSG